MGKAFRGEAVVKLPRALNNAVHGCLLLARRVNSFQLFVLPLMITTCVFTEQPSKQSNSLILFLFSHPLTRVHAMFELGQPLLP